MADTDAPSVVIAPYKRLTAEGIGTFWLVLGGCGAAVISGGDIGILGVSLAFGLTVMTMAYAMGPISGGHFNPAVTIGLWVARRHQGKDVGPYIAAQIIGAISAASILAMIAGGQDDFDLKLSGFAANGYGAHSPAMYSMGAALLCEIVLTAGFVWIILCVTAKRAAAGFAPIAIGLALTLVHLISIPVTNTSVNPARSISQALFVNGWALEQLWLFIVAPVAGAVIAAYAYMTIYGDDT